MKTFVIKWWGTGHTSVVVGTIICQSIAEVIQDLGLDPDKVRKSKDEKRFYYHFDLPFCGDIEVLLVPQIYSLEALREVLPTLAGLPKPEPEKE